ncbi:hypothetical protein FHR93_004158 [Geodermatophilus sabuli]|uniref:Uncharacterized protein n=1 Tax=Geodermatophilus sabuli TaxID=1564158 RepID=A0A285EHD7_9ACTN|nr:hypothetical protein [Geodermatophilus sabuli]SNX98273.1 hypothetical protein SAMN06893097_11054 [Geodermatophilus sabuli]
MRAGSSAGCSLPISERGGPDGPGDVRETRVDGTTSRPDGADWSWPPSAAVPHAGAQQFVTERWAPASTVRHPWVRVGRWTLLYRRAA